MKRVYLFGLALSGLAACGGGVPESNPGVGFQDYGQYANEQQQREAALQQSNVSATPLSATSTVASGGIASSELSAVGINSNANLGQSGAGITDTRREAGVSIEASPSNAAPILMDHPGLSDEQDFEAVSARETIESDAQRRAALASQYTVVQATALPERDNGTGPNIVEYALNAPNVKGQEWYSRFVLSGKGRFERNCAGFNTPDEAQRYFLAHGGPDRDTKGIDPDGDGFACGWDPAPFIAAVRAGN